MATATKTVNRVNGLDMDALAGVMGEIERDPTKGLVEFRVRLAGTDA